MSGAIIEKNHSLSEMIHWIERAQWENGVGVRSLQEMWARYQHETMLDSLQHALRMARGLEAIHQFLTRCRLDEAEIASVLNHQEARAA